MMVSAECEPFGRFPLIGPRFHEIPNVSISPSRLRFEDSTDCWEHLNSRVKIFLAAWEEQSTSPEIARFIEDLPESIRSLVLIELLKVDMAQRLARGLELSNLEENWARYAKRSGDPLPCDLIWEDYHLRHQAGQQVSLDDYCRRYPQHANALNRLGQSKHTRSLRLTTKGVLDQIDVGDRLDEFELLALLGSGTFGKVFLALQRSMQRLIAIKVTVDHGPEASTLAQLDHAHIVRVYDVRELPEQGLHILIMEQVSGGSLQDMLRVFASLSRPELRCGRVFLKQIDHVLAEREQQPPAESALRRQIASWDWPTLVGWLGARLALALDYAHRQGVLHRDLKPANILFTAEGSPRLVDFNVSFAAKLEGANPKRFFGGTLPYMSPEQLEAFDPQHPRGPETLDGRSDLYALGIVLWELLSGQRPFREEWLADFWANTPSTLARKRLAGIPEQAMDALPADTPTGLRQVLLCCLEPDPNNRFANGADMAHHLDCIRPPHTAALLHPNPHNWAARISRRPLSYLVIAGLLPNVITAVFNLIYNYQEIVTRLGKSADAFWTVQSVINGIAFPVGIAFFLRFTWLVRDPTNVDPAWQRQRCLRLGEIVGWISLIAWTIAGVAYPMMLYATIGRIAWTDGIHFMLSLGLCGLMAVTYSFFSVTTVAVHGVLPTLIRWRMPLDNETEQLDRLERRLWPYLWLAAAVPLLSITALVWFDSESSMALGVLSLGGLIGYGVVFQLAQVIRSDLKHLRPAFRLRDE